MNILSFTKANCKNCYKCVRHCPVKAIKVKDQQAEIVTDKCIGCGECLVVCPQNAKSVRSDLEKIKLYINSGEKVIVSIAPSFPSAFEINNPLKIVNALRKLGFYRIEETAVGAEIISKEYYEHFTQSTQQHLITSACPTINYLIETYYPNLINYLIPVVSPMIAHGLLLKEQYKNSKVVFIGPCISKKFETDYYQHNDVIDGILTFDELHNWFKEEGIILNDLKESRFDTNKCSKAREYPITGGINNCTIKEENCKRRLLQIDGIENCIDILDNLENENLGNTFIEINACIGGCINGPGNTVSPYSKFFRIEKVKDYIKYINKNGNISNKQNNQDCNKKITLNKLFSNRQDNMILPTEEQIKEVLSDIGKIKKEDELNCGACGYNTCREKAIAVIQGMAEKDMCLPYMRSRGESLSNLIIKSTPNAIIVFDKEFRIVDFNPTAEKFFGISINEALSKPIELIFKNNNFYHTKNNSQLIYKGKQVLEEYNLVLFETLVYIKDQELFLGIYSDITKETKNQRRIKAMRESTLNMAQEVIDKQMRVAQEIASLLGETTAETKVTLTQLKNLVQEQDGE